ncbi:hypothetical protein V2J09_015673 [Rumex salicifolius]
MGRARSLSSTSHPNIVRRFSSDALDLAVRRSSCCFFSSTQVLQTPPMPRRSIWKGPFVDAFLMKIKEKGTIPQNKKIWSRGSTILPEFVGKVVQIYNGNNFLRCKITEGKVGHKFGEFALTSKRRPHAGHIKALAKAKAKR